MVRNMGVASDLGDEGADAGALIDPKALDDLPDDRVVLMYGFAG